MGCYDPRTHVCTAIGAAVRLDWRERAVRVVGSWWDSWRQTVSHKCKHEHMWRRHTQTCSTLCHTLRDCCRVQGFPPHTLLPWRVYILPSSRRSLVRFCSTSKPTAYFEMNIIINFSFTLASLRSGFSLVYASRIKTAVCGYKGSYESITDHANL